MATATQQQRPAAADTAARDQEASPPPGFRVQQEGAARILLPTAPVGSGGGKKGGGGSKGGGDQATQPVTTDSFYNPAQVTNRDLSVAAIRVFLRMRERDIASGRLKPQAAARAGGGTTGHNTARRVAEAAAALAGQQQQSKGADPASAPPPFQRPGGPVRILEGMAASGIRSLRYALELDGSDDEGEGEGGVEGGVEGGDKGNGNGEGNGGKVGEDKDPKQQQQQQQQQPQKQQQQQAKKRRPQPRPDRRRPLVDEVHANDLDPAVVDDLKRNVSLNGPAAGAVVKPLCADVRALLMYAGAGASAPSLALSPEAAASVPEALAACARSGGYAVVDLDPYGTPAHLLDAAVQGVADGGLLAVTATDTAVLCGNHGEVSWGKYGAYPLHRPYCHEGAVRILLACIEAHAARHKRVIEPLLSLSIDFYVRVFVRVRASAEGARASASRQAYVWQSAACDSFWVQRCGDRIDRAAMAAARLEKQQAEKEAEEEEKAKEGGAAGGAAADDAAIAEEAHLLLNKKGRAPTGIKYTPGHGPAVPSVRCPDTGARMLMGGPYWADAIHDREFVGMVLEELSKARARRRGGGGGGGRGGLGARGAPAPQSSPSSSSSLNRVAQPLGGALGGYAAEARVRGLLTCAHEELPDAPLYYDLHALAKTLRCTAPPLATLRSALLNAGHRVSGSHACPRAVKTTAPPEVLWDVLRCWVRDKQPLARPADPDSAGGKILSKAPTLQADFTRASAAVPASAAPGAAPRFVQNPAFWGPRARHGRGGAAVPASGQLPLPKDLRKGGGGGGGQGDRAAGAGAAASRPPYRSRPADALPAELEAADPEDQLAGLYGVEAGGDGDGEKAAKRAKTTEEGGGGGGEAAAASAEKAR